MLSRYYSELEKNIQETIDLCESPIEEKLLYNIIEYVLYDSTTTSLYEIERWFRLSFLYEKRNGVITEKITGIRIDYSGYYEKNLTRYIEIIPQYIINTNRGGYRLDFGVFLKSFESDKLLKKFCVECDGYEFHNEREQIMRDNQRDLILLSNDFQTIRFLGKEINNISGEEITNLLEVLLQESIRNF
jgi:hypothetical protein